MSQKSRWLVIGVVAVLSVAALFFGVSAGGDSQSSGGLYSNKPKLLFFHAAW